MRRTVEPVEPVEAIAAAATALARLLLNPPTPGALERIREPGMLAAWPVPVDTSATREGLAAWAESARRGEDAAAVGRDHDRLFVGPGRLLAPPYESVYRSPDRLLFGEHTLQVRGWYARGGLQAPRLGKEPDDHLGLELEFLAAVCLRALDARDAGDERAREDALADAGAFARQHPAAWAPAWARDVEAGADTAFYAGVAALVVGVLDYAEGHLPSDPRHDPGPDAGHDPGPDAGPGPVTDTGER